MLIFRAWATCGLNNKFSWCERGILLIDVVDVFRLSLQGVIITGEEKYKSKEKRRERKKILSTSFSCMRLLVNQPFVHNSGIYLTTLGYAVLLGEGF